MFFSFETLKNQAGKWLSFDISVAHGYHIHDQIFHWHTQNHDQQVQMESKEIKTKSHVWNINLAKATSTYIWSWTPVLIIMIFEAPVLMVVFLMSLHRQFGGTARTVKILSVPFTFRLLSQGVSWPMELALILMHVAKTYQMCMHIMCSCIFAYKLWTETIFIYIYILLR